MQRQSCVSAAGMANFHGIHGYYPDGWMLALDPWDESGLKPILLEVP